MESPKHHFICTLLVMLAHFHVVNAQNPDQSGFISLDCGLSAGSSYTEKSTELSYVSDAPFISTGVSGSLLPEYGHEYQQQMRHLRSFPEGIRNCYKLNVTKGTKYLIMTSFLYGNYDNRNKTPEFDLHIGVNYWDSVRFRSASAAVSSEIIYTPTRGYVDLCLVNTGQGTPFIQAIELRPLLSAMYDIHDSIALLTVARADLGSVQDITYRYPNDAYDRTRSPFLDRELKALTTNLTVERESHDVDYWLPNKVMQTAAMPSDKISGAIHFYVNPPNLNTRIYIYAHFAELQELQPGEYRAVNIIVDGELLLGPIVPRYLSPITVYNTKALTRKDNYSFSIERPRNSTLPPILNSIEFYIDLEFSQTETLEDDVNAMNSIKSTYNVERDWNGDPCGPADYTWTGVSCSSNNDFDPPRITSLNLSSSGLTGQITEEFSKLAIIDSLDLSNNSLTGSVPEFLASLVNLKVLDISGNNLTGSLPAKLTEKTKNGSLLLRFDENDQILCDSSSCSSKKKSDIVIPIAASIGGLVFLFGIVSTIILLRQKKQNQGVRPLRNMESNIEPLGFDNRKFTFANIKKMTNNFERVLGKGAFGIVYYGLIDNATPVAVKMLSLSSSQGFHEFQTEVMFLVRVHHKNLTSLVGYCNEESNKVLVYEYMANGNLDDYLSGDTRNSNWEGRLNIAIDAAQGLEYLHRGCKPPIVHRDVKTSNILLTENFQAKLSDFGLSKEFPTDDRTHMSTDVAGTPGYLDPEYYSRNRLNEKSDVYSFGVVLLRIITNKPAFVTSSSNERTHIGNWVTAILNIGDIESIVDQRLVREFNINSIWRAVEISINCLSPSANDRPNMNQVVSELNECLAIEHAPRNVVDNIEVLSMNLDTIVNPLAR